MLKTKIVIVTMPSFLELTIFIFTCKINQELRPWKQLKSAELLHRALYKIYSLLLIIDLIKSIMVIYR